jgi:NAD-dependent dihydropyrimidine dehydrogenase PreA subunit
MALVIAEPCIGTKDTACVDACPVDETPHRNRHTATRPFPGSPPPFLGSAPFFMATTLIW